MAYQLFQLPKQLNISSSFTLSAGAKAYFFEPNTTTPQDTYQDSDLSTPHAHPVVADAAGVLPPIYLDPSLTYKLTLNTSADSLIYTVDPVNDQILSQDVVGAVIYPQTDSEQDAGVTPTNFLPALRYDVKRYGAVGDGTTDDTGAVQDALDSIPLTGGILYFPTGNYKITDQLLIPSRDGTNLVPIIFEGESAYFAPDDVGSRITYTPSSGALFQGRGAAGTDTRRGQMQFRNLQIIGPGAGTTAEGIKLYRATGLRMINVLTQGFKYGLRLHDFFYYSNLQYCRWADCNIGVYSDNGQANGTTFSYCAFSDCTGNSVSLAFYGESVHFVGCWFEGATGNQVVLDSGRQASLRGCYWEYAESGYAIVFSRDSGTPSGAVYSVKDCTFQANGTATGLIAVFNPVGTSTAQHLHLENLFVQVPVAGCVRSVCETPTTDTLIYQSGAGVQFSQSSGFKTSIALGGQQSYTGTLTGISGSSTGAITYSANGEFIDCHLAADLLGTSNTTACTITGMPTMIRPATAQIVTGIATADNGTVALSQIKVETTGVLTLYNGASPTPTFTNSGTKGMKACRFMFRRR